MKTLQEHFTQHKQQLEYYGGVCNILFLLGIDYGRWIFLWIVSSMILFSLGYRLPEGIAQHSVTQSFTNPLVLFISYLPRKEWLLLFVGLPILWGVMNFVNASPAGRFLWEMYSLTR